jgi:hypothetical protein
MLGQLVRAADVFMRQRMRGRDDVIGERQEAFLCAREQSRLLHAQDVGILMLADAQDVVLILSSGIS